MYSAKSFVVAVFVFIVTRLRTLYWTTKRTHLQKRWTFLLPAVLVFYSSRSICGMSQNFSPSTLISLWILPLFQVWVCSHFQERLFHSGLLGILVLTIFALSFSIFPEPEMQEEYRCSHWGWVPHNLLLSMFSSGMVFCDGLHLLEEGLL